MTALIPTTTTTRDERVRSPIERLLRFLDKCASTSFFGKVEVTFQNGRVCDVKIQQTKKLDEL
ncbi:MAG TPA: hypothetical protein VFP84_07480 [Kofleriaceae bacterium]|nr:hypothetical protein [Kofleriaceae bacterium]